jgi:hypothetical protein
MAAPEPSLLFSSCWKPSKGSTVVSIKGAASRHLRVHHRVAFPPSLFFPFFLPKFICDELL